MIGSGGDWSRAGFGVYRAGDSSAEVWRKAKEMGSACREGVDACKADYERVKSRTRIRERLTFGIGDSPDEWLVRLTPD